MPITFSKILIPVDFSSSTEIAVNKAIGLIEKQHAEIHLLHILKPKTGPKAKFESWEAEKKLSQWKAVIEETVAEINVKFSIVYGSSVEKMILQSTGILSPNLIIVGKQDKGRKWPFHQTVSPDHIATKSHCPVLTVKPGSIHHRTRIIVLPVGDSVPDRKMELAILIAQKCRAQVHLLAIKETQKGDNEKLSRPFLSTYHQLREKLHHPVEYFPISRHNIARAVVAHAQSVMADMILVNPETESGVMTLIGHKHISELLGSNSKIQILDVQP